MPEAQLSQPVEVRPTAELTPAELAAARALMAAAWPDPEDVFSDEDWAHALGGWHALVRDEGGVIISHGSVVPRRIWIGEHLVAAGYVEAVATRPSRQGRGLGSAVMRALGGLIAERFELGVLSTDDGGFYARLGWEPWHGPTWVRRATGPERTPDDDGGLWVLRTARTAAFSGGEAIACEERPGDDW